MKFKIVTVEQMFKNLPSPIFESPLQRETKTLIILENGLRFQKKDNWALKSKENNKILNGLVPNILFGKDAILIN